MEKKLLAYCIKDKKYTLDLIQKKIEAIYFADETAGTLFKILCWFFREYDCSPTKDALLQAVNQSTLNDSLKGTVPVLYIELQAAIVVEPFSFILDVFLKDYKERELRKTLMAVVDTINSGRIEDAISKTQRTLSTLSLIGSTDVREGDYKDSVKDRLDHYEKIKEGKAPLGLTYGYPTLDSITGGQLGGELWVIMALMKGGKSTLMLNMANTAWKFHKKNVLYVSAEVSRAVLERRLDALNAEVSCTGLKQGTLMDADIDRYKLQLEDIKKQEAMMYIMDTPAISTAGIHAKIQELKSKGKLDLVVVDYLALITPVETAKEDWKNIGNIALELRRIARTEGIPILTAHQTNAEGYKAKTIDGSHISRSKDIGRHCDLILSIKIQDEEAKRFLPTCLMDASIIMSRDSASAGFVLEANFDKMVIKETLALT